MNVPDAVPHHSALGKLLRLPLKAIPNGHVAPILSGPAAGLKWITGSGPHGVWLGINETRKRRLLAEVVSGGTFYDVGAHVGSYVLTAHRAATIVAFEPVPRNLEYLRRHVELNGLANVAIMECAVADWVGAGSFTTDATGLLGHLAPAGEAEMQVTTLDAHGGAPDCIKIDVEGGEAAVLRGAEAVLAEHRPVLFVALHGPQPDVERLLRHHGYRVRELEHGEIVAEAS